MQFFPYLEDMEETVMFVVHTIAKSMQSIPTVQVCYKKHRDFSRGAEGHCPPENSFAPPELGLNAQSLYF